MQSDHITHSSPMSLDEPQVLFLDLWQTPWPMKSLLAKTSPKTITNGWGHTGQHHVELFSHGQNGLWSVDNIKHSLYTTFKRDQHFGTLSQMMEKFEDLTGIVLAEVSILQREGWRYVRAGSERWNYKNPFELTEGAVYEWPFSGSKCQFKAVTENGKMGVKPIIDGQEHGMLDPRLVIRHEDALRIHAPSAAAPHREQVRPRGG